MMIIYVVGERVLKNDDNLSGGRKSIKKWW